MGAADWQSDAGLAAERRAEAPPGGEAAPHAVVAAFDEPTLVENLWAEPFRFDFFAALRVLARLTELKGAPDDSFRSALDQIRFRAHQSLTFPASQIWDVAPLPEPRLAEMTVAFLGLTGPMGVLPRPYTENVLQRIGKRDYVLRDFFDLFNDRLLKLFAQAGAKYRFYYTYEAAAAAERARRKQGEQELRGFLLNERPRDDLFSQMLLDLGGVGTPLLRYKDSVRSAPDARLDVPDGALRYFAGHFAKQHRTALGLGHMVGEYFRVSAEILPFIGQWLPLPEEYQTRLKRRNLEALPTAGPPRSADRTSDPQLGHNAVVGSRTWEVQGRFRVRLGPLKFREFQHFLPVGRQFRQLAHLVRLYVGATFDFDVQPVLEGKEVPWCQFGAKGASAPRLGWNTWLRNRAFTRDVGDAIFRVPDQISMSE